MPMEPTNLHSKHRDEAGDMSYALQRLKNLIEAIDMRNSIQRSSLERVGADAKQLHAGPSNLHTEQPAANPKLRGGVRWHDHADPHFNVPEPIWAAFVGKLVNIVKHLRKVGVKSNQSDVPGKPAQPEQPSQSSERHTCTRHPERTCNCPRGACADDDATYKHARGPYLRAPEPNHLGNFRCPVSGQLCSATVCREWCEAGVDYTKT
jgi:hypothetical protein